MEKQKAPRRHLQPRHSCSLHGLEPNRFGQALNSSQENEKAPSYNSRCWLKDVSKPSAKVKQREVEKQIAIAEEKVPTFDIEYRRPYSRK
ncbi:hypothetical protein SAMN03084138_02797 [Enterovibrio norvegicus DSM 15893]|uniref:Uncharacterized protein n=1 Tax=Enterovibrio norvegicus DSM 15893 TaxID=1121869 RepID=A0A1I5S6N6_9GAMM|nr:hypothetical protein SAMN03084138_02797 [Enterovibrio norvegicus DSM 15893]